MSIWEQAALLDDDLQPIVRRPTRAEVARVRAEIDEYKKQMAEAEASPAGAAPRNRLLEELREEMARPINPLEDEDEVDVSWVGNVTGSSALRRMLDQQQRFARIGTGGRIKDILDGLVPPSANTFAGVAASLASNLLPQMRAWEPLVDTTAHVGADARLHAMGATSLASLPSARTSAIEMFQQMAPTPPAFTSLLTTADLARRTIEETTGLVGAASSARAIFEAVVPTFDARGTLSGLIDNLAMSTTYLDPGLSTTYEAAARALGTQLLPPRVDMTSWASGLSAPAALARLEDERFDSLRQEVLDTWRHAVPGFQIEVDALLGRFAPYQSVPPDAREDVDEDDGSVTPEPSLRDAARAGAALIRAQRPDLSDDPETLRFLAALLQTSVLSLMTWIALAHPALLQHLGTALLLWQSSRWARDTATGMLLPGRNGQFDNGGEQ